MPYLSHDEYCDCNGNFSDCCDNEDNYTGDQLMVHTGIKLMEKIIKTQKEEIKKLKKRVKKLKNRQIVNMNLMAE